MANIICNMCKMEIPDSVEICPDCGSSIAPITEIKCPECSNLVNFSEEACPECGFPRELLKEPSETALKTPELETPVIVNTEELNTSQESEQIFSATPSVNEIENTNKSIDEVMGADVNQMNSALKAQVDALNVIVDGISSMSENSRNTVEELTNKLKEQNLMTLSGFQEILSTFKSELKAELNVIKEANSAAATEITNTTSSAKDRIKEFASKISIKSGNIIDYTLYISIAALLFSMINLFIAAYIVRLIK